MPSNSARWPADGYRANASKRMGISEGNFEAYQAAWLNMISGWDWYAIPKALPVMRLPALHFVGFRDPQRLAMAELVFGPADFEHRVWDRRAKQEIAANDSAIFAKGSYDDRPTSYSWDDSNQPDDPAAAERK